jgi:hypothetical protein
MKFPAAPDLVIAVMQARIHIRKQRREPHLAIDERPRSEIFAVDVEKIEQKEHERRGVAAVGRQLDRAK